MSKKDFLDLLDTNTAEVLEKWGMDKETAKKLTKNTKISILLKQKKCDILSQVESSIQLKLVLNI